MILSGQAAIAGVIGWPVGHSRSPRLHQHWLARYGLDGAYIPLEVQPERLAEALAGVRALGFRGCNITVPHKEASLGHLDCIDHRAQAIGAVNTVIVDDTGRLCGSNTDGYGFIENLRAGVPDWEATSGPVAVIGAGGSARAVLFSLIEAGVPDIRLVNRSIERAERAAADFGPAIRVLDWQQREDALVDCQLLVNTTMLGMTGQPDLPLEMKELPLQAVVTDLVYAPLRTDLLKRARRRGNRVVDGLGMLLHQARPGFAAWFGVNPRVDEALRAAVLG